MAHKTLTQLYATHTGKVSDKWSSYLIEYDRLFAPYRNKPINLLEIGIQNGGSIEIWAQYFEKAKTIIGCDINPDCKLLKFDNPHISVVVGDANSTKAYQEITNISTKLDLVIDDGSHASGDIIKSFNYYFSHITNGGLFIAEDLHCSYWKSFDGGLFDPYSSISFFKLLADIINKEHWGVDKENIELLAGFNKKYNITLNPELLEQVHSVKFINSICVIRKQASNQNSLGKRFISGIKEPIISGHFKLHGSIPTTEKQSNNEWSMKELTPYEELPLLIRKLASKNQELNKLNTKLTTMEQALHSLNNIVSQTEKKLKERSEQLLQANKKIKLKTLSLELAHQKIIDSSKKLERAEEILNSILTDKKKYNRIRHIPSKLSLDFLFNKTKRVLIKDHQLISKSENFSAAYYLISNPDVWKSGENPLSHFNKYGWIEGRNPSANFDLQLYQQDYPDNQQGNLATKYSKLNPLLHYISQGKKEGRLVGYKYSAEALEEKFTHKIIQNKIIKKEVTNKYICLFSHYDKHNVIHRYVINYLKEISFFSDIVFISTCEGLSEQEIKKISHLCTQIIIKKNTGYDFGAWKTGMELSINKLDEYDYLILCNDSVYGPFKNLKSIIASRIGKNDIFAMTESKEIDHHLQSYFVVYSKRAFNHPLFTAFWENIKIFSNKKRLILENEVKYHNRLINSNLSVSSLCPVIKEGAKNQLHYEWKELIESRDFPFIKIELLRDNPLNVNIENWESIINKTGYNLDFIKEHLFTASQNS